MSEFLLITPDGWTEVLNMEPLLTVAGADYLLQLTLERDYQAISNFLEDVELIVPNTLITDARMINSGDGWRFWFIP